MAEHNRAFILIENQTTEQNAANEKLKASLSACPQVQGQAEHYLDAVAAGRRAAKAISTVWNPNYKNWRRVNANHQRPTSGQEDRINRTIIQAGMP